MGGEKDDRQQIDREFHQWLSVEAILFSQRTFGNIWRLFYCHNLKAATGIQWVEVNKQDRYLYKELPSPNCQWCRGWKILHQISITRHLKYCLVQSMPLMNIHKSGCKHREKNTCVVVNRLHWNVRLPELRFCSRWLYDTEKLLNFILPQFPHQCRGDGKRFIMSKKII